jgi:hypothetical protein
MNTKHLYILAVIGKFFRRIFRKPAALFVTLWARHVYRMGVAAADQRHRIEGVTIYLAADSFRPNRLVTYDKAQFKAEKHVYGTAARLLTMNSLRSGCYYHTADRFGRDAMSVHEMTIRRKAFIRERLRMARLG